MHTPGHKMGIKNIRANGTVLWRCTSHHLHGAKFCPGLVEASSEDASATYTILREHICDPDPDVFAKAAIAAEAKAYGRSNMKEGAKTIVEAIARKHHKEDRTIAAKFSKELMVRQVNHHRKRDRPEEPTKIRFKIDKDFLTSRTPSFFQKTVKVGEQRHRIFFTPAQKKILSKAKRWYVDATFKIVKDPFKQLFSIHVFIKNVNGDVVQVPVCFVLMSRMTSSDYAQVLKQLEKDAQ